MRVRHHRLLFLAEQTPSIDDFARSIQLGNQRITRASPAAPIALQYPSRDKIIDVPQRGVGGRVFKLRPFRTGEFSGKAVKQVIDDVALARVERRGGVFLPELRLAQNSGKDGFDVIEGLLAIQYVLTYIFTRY